MNCDFARTLLIPYIKQGLSDDQKTQMEEHLAGCADCRVELAAAKGLLERTEDASSADIIKLSHEIIEHAVDAGASDIHLEPQSDNSLLVRYRIDGVLHEVKTISAMQRDAMTRRIKLMAELNLMETKKPQDGRIPIRFKERDFDLRVSIVPFIFGEGMVMRILDRGVSIPNLEDLALQPDTLARLTKLSKQPMGLILISGPTGSGKTTVAYSLLKRLVSSECKVLSIEDPIEMIIPGVNQVHLHKPDTTFASALRAFLRHDPDVIFVGESRDAEMMTLTCQAAMTGHLVLSTCHADDAVGSLKRYCEAVDERFTVVEATIGISAQRLARLVCQNCREPMPYDSASPSLRFFGITERDANSGNLTKGKGCEVCHSTGYRGRTPIMEVIEMTPEINRAIVDQVDWDRIREIARNQGFQSMKDAARERILEGKTTPEEAFRLFG